MSDISYAYKIVKSLLLEATLKDSFSKFEEDSIIRLKLNDGSEEIFTVRSNEAGRVKVVHKRTNILLTFTQDAMNDDVMTMYEYDKNAKNYQGKPHSFEVKDFLVGKSGGEITEIDVIDPELEQHMSNMNAELKKAKIGDIIYISSEEQRKGGNLINTILLRVNQLEPNMLTCTLDDIITRKENDEETSTNTSDKLANQFRNRNIYIEIDDLVKIKNNELTLNLKTGKTFITLRNLLAVELHNSDSEFEDDDDQKEFAQQELIDKIKSSDRSKEYLEAIAKTPNFWDTLFSASPKGVDQLGKILNQSVNANSYLTPGNYVKFKLGPETNTVFVNKDAKLLKNKIYQGTVEKNNVIKHGKRGQGNWLLKVIEEIDPNTFKVKMSYCNKDMNCKSYGKGTIKVVRNG